MISIEQFKPAFEQKYVALMIDIIGRGLIMASQVDPEIQQEIKGFPIGFRFAMKVFPHGSGFVAEVLPDHGLKLVTCGVRPDLTITFKHVSHAYLVFSFQESTAQAFANDRMIADGEIGYAIRLVRCLNKMESLILPKVIARLAVKSYPNHLSLKQKISEATYIYAKVAQSYLKRSV